MRNNTLVQFKNLLSSAQGLLHGERFLFTTLTLLKNFDNPLKVLESALTILSPGLKLDKQVRAGRIVLIPAKMRPVSTRYRALMFLITAVREQKQKRSFPEKLASEITDSLKLTGEALHLKRTLIKELTVARLNLHTRGRYFKRRKGKRLFFKEKKHKVVKLKSMHHIPRSGVKLYHNRSHSLKYNKLRILAKGIKLKFYAKSKPEKVSIHKGKFKYSNNDFNKKINFKI